MCGSKSTRDRVWYSPCSSCYVTQCDVTNVVKPSAIVDGILFCIPLFHSGWPDFALMARILDSWNCRLSVGKFWQCPCPRLVERRTVLRGRLMSDSQSRFQGPLRHRALSQSKLCLLFRSLLRQIRFLRAAQGLIKFCLVFHECARV